MKKFKFLQVLVLLIALLTACQKNTGIKQFAGNVIKKTAAITPPLCTGDSSKQLLTYITGTGTISGVTSAADSAGNIFTLGNYNGSYDFDPGSGVKNLNNSSGTFLQKINADGTLGWVNKLPPLTNTYPYYDTYSLVVDAAGNTYISYLFDNYEVVKYNSSGVFQWGYSQPAYQISTEPQALAVDKFGNVYLCGIYSAYHNTSPDPVPFGNLFLNGAGTFVEELNSGGSFVGVIKTDSIVQNPVFSPKGVLYDYGKNKDGSQYLRAFDHNAHLMWTNQLEGNDISKFITDNFGNAIIVCGNGGDGRGGPSRNPNTQLGKYDANGNLLFRYVNCGATNVITTNAAGNIFMEGFLTGTQDVDPTPGQFFLSTSNPYSAFYIRELDGAGNFVGAKLQPPGTPLFATIHSIAADASGYLYVSGNAGNSQTNLFVAKYSQCY